MTHDRTVARSRRWSAGRASVWLIALASASSFGCRTLGTRGPNADSVALCRQLTQQGISATERSDWKRAEALLARAVQACPVDCDARRRYGEALWHRGALDAALVEMLEARRLSGEDAALATRTGELYLDMKRVDDAARMVDEALRLDPKYAPAWALRGRVAAGTGDVRQALSDYQRALGYAPDAENVAIQMAETYRMLNEPDRALLALQSVADRYARGEEPQRVMYLEGLAFAALSRHEDAAARLAQAAERDRPTADILYHLAGAELKCGRVANAQASLQRALSVDPGHAASRTLWTQMEAIAARSQTMR